MAVQTRGQLTLIAVPDYTIYMTPPNVMIPVAEDGGTWDGTDFSQDIIFTAYDTLNNELEINGVSLADDKNAVFGRDNYNHFKYTFSRTSEELKGMPSSGSLTFYVSLENTSIGAEDDYTETVTFNYVKAKSGRDGTPAYGVNLWANNQVFIKSLGEDGNYIYEPQQIVLTTELINCDLLDEGDIVYHWYKDGSDTPLQVGSSSTYTIEGGETVSGMYKVEVYNTSTLIASDILGIGVAASGSESFTVLLTNDSQTVSVDRNDLTYESGEVSTGILVYKGATQITDFEVELDSISNNIRFSYDKTTQTITGSYEKNVYPDAQLDITIKVGEATFLKRFYVNASLAGESAKMIKITGPQFFQVDATQNYSPSELQLAANPQNINGYWEWQYYDYTGNNWISIGRGEDETEENYRILEIQFNDAYWQDKDVLQIRAVATDNNGETYKDEYPVYKIRAGESTYTVIPSNENISIVTDVFGYPVGTASYEVDFTAFLGTAEKSLTINGDKIEIDGSARLVSYLINGSKLTITVTRDNYEFVNTVISVPIVIEGKQTIIKNIRLTPAQQGQDAKTLTVSGGQIFKYDVANMKFTNTSSTITCQTNVSYFNWYYAIKGENESYNSLVFTEIGSNRNIEELEVAINNSTSIWTLAGGTIVWSNENDILVIQAKEADENNALVAGGIFDEISLYKVNDGSNGADAAFAYPTNENITITEDEDGNIVAQEFKCNVVHVWGTKSIDGEINCISGNSSELYSVSIDGNVIAITSKNIAAPATNRQGEIGFTSTISDPENASNTFTFTYYIRWTIIKGGVDGNSIESVENYYYASASNDSTQLPEQGTDSWKTTIPSNYNTTNKYLWNYEVITFSKKTDPIMTTPFVIGVYGKEGKGIDSFEDRYQPTSSSTAPSAGEAYSSYWKTFTEIESSFNATNKYLWCCDIISYSDGKKEWVGPRLAAVWGKDGEDGKDGKDGTNGTNGKDGVDGKDGKTIVSRTPYYVVSDSNTTAPENGWSTTAPTVENTSHYVWQKDLLIYDDGDSRFTDPFLSPGARSDSIAKQIYDGTLGLNMTGGSKKVITSAVLNNTDGLKITNIDGCYLQAGGNNLGIYDDKDALQVGLYTDNGVTGGIIRGTIYADRGCIGTLSGDGGWTIQGASGTIPAAIYSGKRSSLSGSSQEGIYIGTDGLSFGSATKDTLVYDVNDNSLTIKGQIYAESLTLTHSLNMSDISGFDTYGLRKYLGIYSGSSTTEASSPRNGDIFIKYADGSDSTDDITISASSFSLSPTYTEKGTSGGNGTYNGISGVSWNCTNHSGSSSDNISTKLMKIGYVSSSYRSCAVRYYFIPTISGGASSLSSFKLTFTGVLKPSGASNDPYTTYSTPLNNIDIGLFDSATATTPIFSGSISLSGLTADTTALTFTCIMSANSGGTISSGSTYYLILKGNSRACVYIEKGSIAIEGQGSTVVSASISVRSNGNWVSIAGSSAGGYEDTNTTYSLSLSGTTLTLKGSDGTTNLISLPTYTAGDGITISNNKISVSRNITISTDSPSASGTSGDLWFKY